MTTPTERLAALAEEIAEAERLITKFSDKPPSRFFTRIVERSRENLAAAEREKAALEGVLASRRRREAQEVQGPQRAAAAAVRLRELIIEHKGPARIRVWTKKRVGTRLYFPGDAGYLVFGWDGGVSSMDRGRQTLAWGALYPRWRKAVRAAIEVYRDENTERIEADIAAQRGRPSRQRQTRLATSRKGRPNVGARIARLAVRRRSDGKKRTTARGDEHFWSAFLDTVQSFLGASVECGSIVKPATNAEIEADLAKHPPSVLDRWLPWLYENVADGYNERLAALGGGAPRSGRKPLGVVPYHAPEDWRELRHWIEATRPDLSTSSLQTAIYLASEWSEHLVEVGGGGPLAENLHERMGDGVLDLGKGWVWRSDGHEDVWMAIGRELGHCYKHDFHLKGYINGLMWVLVGPKGKPHVTVTVSDCEIEAKGFRNQLPMFRYHKAVWALFEATSIWHELDGCDPGGPQPDLEALTLLPPKSLLDSDMWLTRSGEPGRVLGVHLWGPAKAAHPSIRDARRRARGRREIAAHRALYDGIDRWRRANEVLADIPGAFPKAFWTYIDAVQAFSRWALDFELAGGSVSAGPHPGRPFSWVVLLRARAAGVLPPTLNAELLGVSPPADPGRYAVDASSQASFVKSIRRIVGSK